MKNATILGITYDEPKNLNFPSATFCPQEIFKEKYFTISDEEFDRISFKEVNIS